MSASSFLTKRAGQLLRFSSLSLLVALAFVSNAQAQDGGCKALPPAALGANLSTPVKLTPDRDTEIVNFSGGRGTKERDLLIIADPALPKSVTVDQLSIDLSRRFERVGGTLPSETLAEPTFTEPVISPDRREISFTVCLTTDGAKAGSYTGVIRVSGPDGLERAVVATTINVKAQWWVFVLALIAALAVATFLLIFRRVRDDSESKIIDLPFILQSLLPLGVAAGAMYAVYAQNPAWGDDPITAGLGLVGTALAAAGLKSLLDAEAGRKS